MYSEGEVAALLRPGEKGPLTRLSPAPAPAAAPAGPAGVAAVRLDTAELAGLVSERRVYADDDDLYMSVELSRRSSHLTNVISVAASPAARHDPESEDQKPSYMAKNVSDKIINNFAGLSTSIDSTGFIRDHMEDEWMTFSR